MTRKEEIIEAGIEYTMSNRPVCMCGDAFGDTMREFNRSAAFEAGAKWADSCPPKGTSLIKWQTGEPKERGHYLVTIRYCYAVHADSGREDYAETVTKSIWSGFWQVCSENMHCEVIAWCKLSDIEPYKEE